MVVSSFTCTVSEPDVDVSDTVPTVLHASVLAAITGTAQMFEFASSVPLVENE